MSAMEDPKQSVPAMLGEMERQLREQVEAARQFAARGQELLDRLFGASSTPQPGSTGRKPRRYSNMDPLTAIKEFLDAQDRPMTDKEIVEELIDGKVKTGSEKMSAAKIAGNVKRSLFANSKTAKSPLVKVGEDRYGLREWPKEKLKAE